MDEIKLHDIKTIVDVEENSLYYFSSSIVLGILILIIISILVYKWLKKRNAFSLKKENLALLNSLEFSDAKKCAYDFTSYGAIFRDDSEQNTKAYDELVQTLQEYKYKKNVQAFDAKIIERMKKYVEMCNA